ncbi:MAG: hypothetical protein PVJ66_10035, partial [Gammaproteobacteria bacterium]
RRHPGGMIPASGSETVTVQREARGLHRDSHPLLDPGQDGPVGDLPVFPSGTGQGYGMHIIN